MNGTVNADAPLTSSVTMGANATSMRRSFTDTSTSAEQIARASEEIAALAAN